MQINQSHKFIKKLYLHALFPNIIAVLGGTINVFFDGILVGQKLGDIGLKAINQCMPVYLILCALGALIASGGAQLSAIAFGKDEKEEGKRLFKVTLLISIFASIFLCGIGLLFSSPITKILAVSESYSLALTYMRITLLGGIFKVVLYAPYFYLRLEGKNKSSMTAMLTMTALNILLDVIFLFVFDFGMAGAAWASVLATAICCIMSFLFLFTGKSNFAFSLALPKRGDMKGITKFGGMMALNNVLTALKILLLNKLLASVGGKDLTAVFAIVNSISEFSICLQNGVPQASGAMLGILYGERDTKSAQSLLHTELLAGVVGAVIFSVALCVFSSEVASMFGSKENVDLAVYCFAISLVFAVVNNVFCYFYNATGNTEIVNVMTVCRGCLFYVLFCLLFKRSQSLVWWFFPAAEIATLLLVLGIGYAIARKKKLQPLYLLDDSMERSGTTIAFAVPCDKEEICKASENVGEFCEQNDMSPKTTMAISLAIEEILTIIAEKSLQGQGEIDVRILKAEKGAILRIRSGGKRYNPIAEQDNSEDYMGIKMIVSLAKNIEYQSTLGVNTILVYM